MATWIVGDIHGCAEDLARLLERIGLGPGDRLVSVGDLFHRGPDPVGVMELLDGVGARFVLGNHEHRVLARLGLAPTRADGSDRPPVHDPWIPLAAADLAGDGDRPCEVAPERRVDIVRFLQRHDGFFLEQPSLAGAGTTPDGRGWCVVHAGVVPGRSPARSDPLELTRLRRLPGRGRPYWYEAYRGPNLVLFGHTPSALPRMQRHGGALVALGLDTGCVYGGKLTAYSPELDELVQVQAQRAYAEV